MPDPSPSSWRMHAHRAPPGRGGAFIHVFPAAAAVRLCGGEDVVPVVVSLARDEESEPVYWGWIGNGDEVPGLIYPDRRLLALCFAGGLQHAIEQGRGRVVRLVIEPSDAAAEATP